MNEIRKISIFICDISMPMNMYFIQIMIFFFRVNHVINEKYKNGASSDMTFMHVI